MSDETKTFKYVILRNREGEYLVPYSGVHGLADVAFTGKYSDLIDVPDADMNYLPVSIDVTTGNSKYVLSSQLVINDEELLLDYDIDYLVDEGTPFEDLAGDVNAVNSKYVYDVSSYMIDSLQEQFSRAKEYIDEQVGPTPGEDEDEYADVTKRFMGYVKNFEDLTRNPSNPEDLIIVIDGVSVQVNTVDFNTLQVGDVYYVINSGEWYMYAELADHTHDWVVVSKYMKNK